MYNASVTIKNIRLVKSFSHGLNTPGEGQLLIITWILDLFSWWMLHIKQKDKNIIKNTEIKGVIIIDEIEKHLNAEWQESIMKTLLDIFPKLQFMGSTNSIILIEDNFNSRLISL